MRIGTRSGSSRVAAGALFALAIAAYPTNGLGRAFPMSLDALAHVIGVTKESPGAVTVELTPTKYADGRLLVDITVTTHTLNDLDRYDLKKMVALIVNGKGIAPTAAPALRGHHNRGQLVFPVEALPAPLIVEIRGLDAPATRVLKWP